MNAKRGLLALVLLTMRVCPAMAMPRGNVGSSVTVTASPPEITARYLDPEYKDTYFTDLHRRYSKVLMIKSVLICVNPCLKKNNPKMT